MIYTRNAQEKSWLRWAVILLTVMVAPSDVFGQWGFGADAGSADTTAKDSGATSGGGDGGWGMDGGISRCQLACAVGRARGRHFKECLHLSSSCTVLEFHRDLWQQQQVRSTSRLIHYLKRENIGTSDQLPCEIDLVGTGNNGERVAVGIRG